MDSDISVFSEKIFDLGLVMIGVCLIAFSFMSLWHLSDITQPAPEAPMCQVTR